MNTKIAQQKQDATEVVKEKSMLLQKAMVRTNYDRLTAAAKGSGEKVVSLFVPGNLNELLMTFGLVGNYPEINALQAGLKKQSGAYVIEAERFGQSEDVCTYVKSDLGMMRKGNLAPTGEPLPIPDLLLLTYSGCFTFMKWFELLRHEHGCETIMLHVPYQGDGEITQHMRDYVVKQLKDNVIPAMERISGVKFDIDRMREYMKLSAQAEDDLVWVFESAKHKRSPIDSYFGGMYYVGPMFSAFRGTQGAVDFYRELKIEIQARIDAGEGPVTPEGPMKNDEKYRLIVDGPLPYTHMREFWKMFYDEGAVVVASTYTKVGGVYEDGFRHNPEDPLVSMADYMLGGFANRNVPQRIKMLENYVNDYEADGLLVNSVKSCNSYSSGQLLMMNEVEKRTGKPAAFVESDLVDPRYFSAANIKNRLESYFQMIDQKRATIASHRG